MFHFYTPLKIKNQRCKLEMYKVVNGGSPEIMKEICRICEENGCNLKHQTISNVQW